MSDAKARSIRAIMVRELSNDIGIARCETISLPPPKTGEVQINLKAASVNFPDLLMVQGKYQHKPSLPFVPGMEGTGVVTEVGAEVSGFNVGDKIIAGLGIGGFAEATNVRAGAVRPLPQGLTFAEGAAYGTAYLTAYVSLVCRGSLQAGENLLVHGAAGGVGMAAVEVGKILGARVIATSASDDKLAVVKTRGADAVVNVTNGFREQVLELTNGQGADVIYDPVGGDVFDESLRCIRWNGRLLVVGFASGRIPVAPVNIPLIKGFSIVGVRAGEYGRRDPQAGAQNIATIDGWAAEGKISPYIGARFPLEQAVDAMRLLETRQAIGKIVVMMDREQEKAH
ncbi:MAG: NADPH:quinone oxidoreductase family protein [Parvularculales bacterium]